MNLNHLNDSEFIDRLTEFTLANLEDENLSVKDLAEKSGMSPHAINQRLHTIKHQHLNSGNLAYYRNDFYTAIDWYLQALAGHLEFLNQFITIGYFFSLKKQKRQC